MTGRKSVCHITAGQKETEGGGSRQNRAQGRRHNVCASLTGVLINVRCVCVHVFGLTRVCECICVRVCVRKCLNCVYINHTRFNDVRPVGPFYWNRILARRNVHTQRVYKHPITVIIIMTVMRPFVIVLIYFFQNDCIL